MIIMDTDTYSAALKLSYFVAAIPMAFVILSAFLSAKQMGGTLGEGLKKIAAGSIIHTIIILTYILIEKGARGFLNEQVVGIFFFIGGTSGAAFLISGYSQMYKLAKRLKLFTV